MITKKVVVAVGLHTHTLLFSDEKGEMVREEVAQSVGGASRLLELGPDRITFVGNREWCKALAYYLSLNGNGTDIRYVAKPTRKGERLTVVGFGERVFEGDNLGRPFFEEKRPAQERPEPDHSWYQTTQGYLGAANAVRAGKHHLLSHLTVIFPEANPASSAERKKGKPVPLPIPPGLWTRKMRGVVDNPNPQKLQDDQSVPDEIRQLAKTSLGLSLPEDVRQYHQELYREHLQALRLSEESKKSAMVRLRQLVGDHSMLGDWPTSESIVILVGLLGWREWRRFNELRHFAGLAVSRIDGKGNQRTSRQRGPIRQYLYLLMTKTDLGKRLAEHEARHAKIELARVLSELFLLEDWGSVENDLPNQAKKFVKDLKAGMEISRELYDLGLTLLKTGDKDTVFGKQCREVGRKIRYFNRIIKRMERLLRGLWWAYLRDNPRGLPQELN